MGDAYIPFADGGSEALFYNPAALGKIKGVHFEPANFQVQANSDFVSAFDRNSYKVTSLSQYKDVMKPDTTQGVSAALLPGFYFRGFGIGVLAQSRLMSRSEGENIYYRSEYQLIPAFGGGLRLGAGILRIGYSLQWVNQASNERTVSKQDSPLGYNQGLLEGQGFSHTAGVALTIPIRLLPAINIVARNIGTLRYFGRPMFNVGQNPAGTLPNEPMTVDAAFSIQPKLGKGIYFNIAVEDRDAANVSGISTLGRICAGIELSIRDMFLIRGGWGSGYPSAGIGLRRPSGEFSMAWFSEEAGKSYHEKQDTRLVIHYQVRAF